MRLRKLVTPVISLFIAMLMFIPAAASSDAKVMMTRCSDKDVKVYVKGTSSSDRDITCQIGTAECGDVKAQAESQDDNPMRTLLMLDNSLSVPKESREAVTQILNGIIDGHADKEEIRLATFSDKISYLSEYSTDYTALKNLASSISYQDQETYLTDVLYDLLGEFQKENYEGYQRIVVISDGVDNKPIGITKEELYDAIQKTPYPTYTIGMKNGKNDEELGNMFALSRMTNAENFCIDEDNSAADIAGAFKEDGDLTIYSAVLPDSIKNGSAQSGRLVLADKTELGFNAQMPFGDTAAVSLETSAPTQMSESAEPTTETEDVKADEGLGKRKIMIIAGGVILLALIAAVIAIIIIMLNKKKKAANDIKGQPVVPQAGGSAYMSNASGDADKTVILGADGMNGDDNTVSIFDNNAYKKCEYMLTLTDQHDYKHIFQKKLSGQLTIGRDSGKSDIVIDYDKSVSGVHCMISNKDNRIMINDLGSSNKTILNGRVITGESDLYSGDVIKLGAVELKVEYSILS